MAGTGAVGHDGLRQPAGDGLAGRAAGRRCARIGTLGMSMGSTMAWWLAALDERVKVTVDICCLTDFHTLVAKKGLAGHGVYYYVPRSAQAIHHRANQRAHRPSCTPRPRGPAGQADAGRRPRHHRPRAHARLRRTGSPRAVEAPAVRRRARRDAGRTAGDYRLPAAFSLNPHSCHSLAARSSTL